ncbi:MAG TPA: hypothetical protein VFM18_20270 [Methanosarcina sp.]|nr:hypothetical protein [Methanosarcina sp.]
MKSDKVIHIGDTIKILDASKFIHRVGYPLIWTDFYDDMFEDERIKKIADELGCQGKAFSALCKAAAMGKVNQEKFGGNERKIIYEKDAPDPYDCFSLSWEIQQYENQTFEVTDKKTAKTGIRFPAHSWTDSYSGEYNYESGGLGDEKTHILLQIENHKWIESIHVEKVMK